MVLELELMESLKESLKGSIDGDLLTLYDERCKTIFDGLRCR